jgi:hypothetical protein
MVQAHHGNGVRGPRLAIKAPREVEPERLKARHKVSDIQDGWEATVQCHRDEIHQKVEGNHTAQQLIHTHGRIFAWHDVSEPFTAHDIGQAGSKKRDGEDQEKQIEHRARLLPNRLIAPAVSGL